MKTEKRFQVRAAQGEEFALAGRALTYNEVSSNEIAPGVRERIMPGCFRDALASGEDIKALCNHDVSQVLGRTKNGTLTLSDRADGLYMRVQLDKNNSAHRDIYASVKRGDLDEMSFAFEAQDEDFSEGEYNGQRCTVRNLRKAALRDVSIVTAPFYGNGATQVSARSKNNKRDRIFAESERTGKSLEQLIEEREFDKQAKFRAAHIRQEIFQTAPAFRALYHPGETVPYDIVPDYSFATDDQKSVDIRNAYIANLIGEQIQRDRVAFNAELEERRRIASLCGRSGDSCFLERPL